MKRLVSAILTLSLVAAACDRGDGADTTVPTTTTTTTAITAPIAPESPPEPTATVELEWTRTAGLPVDGVFWAIAIEPGDSSRLYAAVENLGFMLSDDGGATWERIDPGHHWLRGIVLDPTDGNLAYFLQGQGLSVIDRRAGREIRTSGLGREFGYWSIDNRAAAVAIDPSGRIYVGGPHGVYRSADKGATIARIGHSLPDQTTYSALALDPTDPGIVYVGTRAPRKYDGDPGQYGADPARYVGRGVFRSLDGGENWTALGSGSMGLDINEILVHPMDPTTLYLATFTGIYRSTNGGASWAPANEGLSHREVWVLVMDPRDPDRMFAGTWGGGLFSTSDGGDTWEQTAFGGIDSRRDAIFSLAFDPGDPDTLYVGTGDGLFRFDTRDGSWSQVTGTVFYSSASYLAVDPSDSAIVYVLEGVPPLQGGRDLYRSQDGGESWEFIGPWRPIGRTELFPHTYGMQVAVDPLDPTTVYYSSGFGFYVSRDGGDTWSLVSMRGVLPDQFHFHGVAVHPQNPNILYLGTGGGGEGQDDPRHAVFSHMLRSEDGGRTWALIDEGLPRRNYHTWMVLVHPEDPDVAYMGTTSAGWPPSMYDTSVGVYKTVDGGRSWFAANEGLRSREILGLVFHPSDPDTLYAAALDSLYVSRDAGGSWESLLAPGALVSSVVVDPRNPNVMFAGTRGGGVYASADGGHTWTPVNSGLGDGSLPDIQHLVIDPQSATIYAAAGGVFKATYAVVANGE